MLTLGGYRFGESGKLWLFRVPGLEDAAVVSEHLPRLVAAYPLKGRVYVDHGVVLLVGVGDYHPVGARLQGVISCSGLRLGPHALGDVRGYAHRPLRPAFRIPQGRVPGLEVESAVLDGVRDLFSSQGPPVVFEYPRPVAVKVEDRAADDLVLFQAERLQFPVLGERELALGVQREEYDRAPFVAARRSSSLSRRACSASRRAVMSRACTITPSTPGSSSR